MYLENGNYDNIMKIINIIKQKKYITLNIYL